MSVFPSGSAETRQRRGSARIRSKGRTRSRDNSRSISHASFDDPSTRPRANDNCCSTLRRDLPSTWPGKLHLCHVVSIHVVRKIGFSVNEESRAKGLGAAAPAGREGARGRGMAATSCIVRSQRDKFIIALMRVRRGFLPQPPQGAPWRLAAIREDDIA